MPQFLNATPILDTHPQAHNVYHDVKSMYGAKGDGVTNDAVAIQAAVTAASGGGVAYFPQGSYFLADGVTITVPQSARLVGAGRRRSSVTSKNAYAFTSTSVDNLVIQGFSHTLRSGSTSGGAIKLDSSASSSVSDIEANGVSTSTDPLVYGKGAVTNYWDQIALVGGGFKIDNTGTTLAFGNANVITRCRVASALAGQAAISINGTANTVRDCVLESNRGYGINIVGGATIVDGCWFEDNSNHDIYVPYGGIGQWPMRITNNNFYANHGDIGTARHISLEDIAAPSSDSAAIIMGNLFADAAALNLYIGTNWEHTVVIGNRKLWPAVTTDNGTGTLAFGNWDPSNQGLTKLGDPFSPPLKVKGTTQTGDNGDLQNTAMFAVSDTLLEDEVAVLRTGHGVFHTVNVPPDQMPTNSFAFYWDNAAGKIKARIRRNDGTFFTADVTP